MKRLMKVNENGKLLTYVSGDAWREAEWRECWACGKEFAYPIHYDMSSQNKGRFCSNACVGKWSAKLYAHTRVKKRCVICYKFFAVNQSKAHRYKTCGNPDCVWKLRSQTTREYWKKKRELRRGLPL